MVINILSWLAIVALAILFGWVTWRTWQVKNAVLKWGGLTLFGLLTLVFALVTLAIGRGLYVFYVPRNAPVANLTLEGTPEQLARGEHIAQFSCAGCHTTNGQLPLSGGKDVGKESPLPIGELVSINLTPGGPLQDWSDGEIFRALRHGVDRQGKPLIAMSAISTRFMSDDDLKAVIAYLRSQPAVTNDLQQGDNPNLLFTFFAGANLIPAPPPAPETITVPPKGPTAEYGKYIVTIMGCGDCHGPDLNGGKSGGLTPVGPSLKIVSGWTQEQFITTLRTGVDPGGHAMNDQMPWESYAHFDDDELAALYLYLKNLPPVVAPK